MALSNNERQALFKERHGIKPKSELRCRHCGGYIWGEYAVIAGFHQRCDPAGYMKRYRAIKRGGA